MVTIRPLEQADKPAWTELWRAYLAFYKTEKPPSVFEWTWGQIMSGENDMYGRLAVVDELPVGLAHFLYHRSFWEPGPRCYLNDLYVSPDCRGTGAGRALIEAVNDHAKGQGAAQVYWLTAEDNYPGRILYDKVAQKTPFIKYLVPAS